MEAALQELVRIETVGGRLAETCGGVPPRTMAVRTIGKMR